jgi:tetratricopeptide (TPR) repeat protein
MNVTSRVARTVIIALLTLLCITLTPVRGQDAAAGGQKYTMAEYNAYKAADAEKNPAAQLKLLDDFVAKYPNSALLNYVYPMYYRNYGTQRNFQKVIEYADKYIALGDAQTNANDRNQAYYLRAIAYINLSNTDPAVAKSAYTAAMDGAKLVETLPKPEGFDDAKFADEKKKELIIFDSTAGNAATVEKDYPSAIAAYKAVLAITPDEFITNYTIGKVYMSMTPPALADAQWYFARAASSKTANEAQSKQVKAYLRKVIANYQGGTVCDVLTDAELNELLQLASTTPDRPASYKLYSSADLTAAQKDMTIASVVVDLKAGGDKAKLTWTASCGLEFPDVPGKIIEVTPGADSTQLKVAFVTSDAEFETATTPNMDVKVVGQPEAAKLEKDNPVHFTGTLMSYDPDPAFMLHWDKAKVNDEDLPKEKGAPKKPAVKKPVAKKPSS